MVDTAIYIGRFEPVHNGHMALPEFQRGYVWGRDQVRGRPAWITQNESIWSATWEENGVSYVAEVECSRPTDARCQSPDVLVELTESLVFVGGAGPISATSDRALPEPVLPEVGR